jgi:hypothetical protein
MLEWLTWIDFAKNHGFYVFPFPCLSFLPLGQFFQPVLHEFALS